MKLSEVNLRVNRRFLIMCIGLTLLSQIILLVLDFTDTSSTKLTYLLSIPALVTICFSLVDYLPLEEREASTVRQKD